MKFSDIQTTLSSLDTASLMDGGTSCAIRVPYSSTISIVTVLGRGKDESQNTAATKSLHMHFPRPTHSRSMVPEKTFTESSSSTIVEMVAASRGSTRTTPGFVKSLEMNSSERIWINNPTYHK